MLRWSPEETHEVRLSELAVTFRCQRQRNPRTHQPMVESLRRCGQLTPVVVCRIDGRIELVDGAKRLDAAREAGFETLSARFLEADSARARAAALSLNAPGGGLGVLEEGWIVHSMIRDDCLSVEEVVELLGRDKTWVSRRLALIEGLDQEVRTRLGQGLIRFSLARELVPLPEGNQRQFLECIERDSLTAREAIKLVQQFKRCPDREGREFILAHPRKALAQAGVFPKEDPRLSPVGNKLAKRLWPALDWIDRVDGWIRSGRASDLTADDHAVLAPELMRLVTKAELLASRCEDVFGYGFAFPENPEDERA